MDDSPYAAVILAGGLSSRMGAFKPLMKLGSATLLERCVLLFHGADVRNVIVVVGHRAKELIPELTRLDCAYVLNEHYRDGMFASIQAGLRALPAHCQAFFLLPVDIPLVSPTTVLNLIDGHNRDPSISVFHPKHHLQRGHPPLFSAQLAGAILAYHGSGGMRGFLNEYGRNAVEIPVDDPFILLDADTPEGFALLAEKSDQEFPRGRSSSSSRY